MLIPKIEKITLDATFSHFLVMFGYKLFSLYFPLFLVARGFSLPEVGYTYLLIYLPLAFSAPIVGFFNHKINPAILATFGILGYGLYALGMILIQDPSLFYFWQILLGISAALFFASLRAILMGSFLENPERAFGWFYSAPFYADAFAPAVGAFFIWRFNFVGVFILSLLIHIFNAIYCLTKLTKPAQTLPDRGFKFENFQKNYLIAFQKLKSKTVLGLISISFSILLLIGFYRAFFVLFLKQELIWSQGLILAFGAIFSLLFFPASWWVIKKLEAQPNSKNIFWGGMTVGFFTILFGAMVPLLNFFSVLLINIGRSIGNLMVNSGRSGLINRELKDYPEEAGAIDTIFSPLGVAIGSLISGMLIFLLGFKFLFILGGILVLATGILAKRFAKF
jgi:MFS family permease